MGRASASLRRLRSPWAALVILILAPLVVLGLWWLWDAWLKYPHGPTVRVATWNLRHFSDRPGVDVAAIARVIRESRFDLVAIQEVRGDGEQVARLVELLGPPWRAAALSPVTGNHERFAFIYNAERVQECSPPHSILTAAVAGVVDRWPYQCTFRAGQFDFTLVSVHLSYANENRRAAEAKVITDFAAALVALSEEKDVIVLGDFNEQGRGNLHLFEANGWLKLNRRPTNLSGSAVYDNILIHPDRTGEWSGACRVVRFDEALFDDNDAVASERVSDHRPVYADFVIDLEDDD